MPLTLLRWQSGAGGDTVLKILLDSNPGLQSQNQYTGLDNNKTQIDIEYVTSFKYNEISKMSLMSHDFVDADLLTRQLRALEEENTNVPWLLKTHCYFNFHYPVIDITVDQQFLPFLVKSTLAKNFKEHNTILNYNSMITKIKDPTILYKYNCYNLAVSFINNCMLNKNLSQTRLSVKNILGGWESLNNSLKELGFCVADHCKLYYKTWLSKNQSLLPSKYYIELVENNNLDYRSPKISIEEKYCLLALAREKFKIINN
jgi:hypothetical protein